MAIRVRFYNKISQILWGRILIETYFIRQGCKYKHLFSKYCDIYFDLRKYFENRTWSSRGFYFPDERPIGDHPPLGCVQPVWNVAHQHYNTLIVAENHLDRYS